MSCVFSKSVYNNDCCTGHGAARLARLHGVQEALGSNPSAPTKVSFSRENEKEDVQHPLFRLYMPAAVRHQTLSFYSANFSIPIVQITQCFMKSSTG